MLTTLVTFSVIFCLGVAVASIKTIGLVNVIFILFLSLTFGLLYRHKTEIKYLYICLSILFFGFGVLRVEVASWQFGNSALETELGSEIVLEGVVVREPDYREKSVQLYVNTGDDLVLVTADRLMEVVYGDVIEFRGPIERPESFETDLGRTFDYPKYLQARGVEYRVSFAEVRIIGKGEGNVIIAYLLQLKSVFIDSIEQLIQEPEVGLGKGLLLGVKSSLGEEIEDNFRRTGIIHIVVLSGYNVMLVVSFILFCFSFFMTLRWRLVSGVLAIVSFALIVGLSATVVRASIMASLVLFAQAFGKQYDVLKALIVAGLIMILINPYLLLYDIGFQLSFMATLGLILLVPKFETNFIKNENILQAKDFVLATVATQIAVLPLLLFHIGEISLIAVLVNLLVLPMVPIAMLLTFLSGVVGLVSVTLGSLIAFIASLSLSYILFVAHVFGSLSFAAVAVPEFSIQGVLLLYFFIAMGYWYVSRPKNITQLNLLGWTIVEEKETAGCSDPSSESEYPADDIPVFFR
jgi:competence protein ComEC